MMSRSSGQDRLLTPSRDAKETGCSVLLGGVAFRRSDWKRVRAWEVRKEDGPFVCPGCRADVIHRNPWKMRRHFAHHGRLSPWDTSSESRLHLQCKREMFRALRRAVPSGDWECDSRRFRAPRWTNGKFRKPDICGTIGGMPLAIEIQKSTMGIRNLIARTKDYTELGMAMLWVIPLTRPIGEEIFRPRLIERYLHALYFGRVYYWLEGMGSDVLPVHFAPATRLIPFRTNEDGRWEEAGSYECPYKIIRRPASLQRTLRIERAFRPAAREEFLPWGETRPIPAVTLWKDTERSWWSKGERQFLQEHYSDTHGDLGVESRYSPLNYYGD